MAAVEIKTKAAHSLNPRKLSLPERTLPPALPLIISTLDSWNPHSCKLETTKTDTQHHHLQLVEATLELLHSIDKPLAILSICGPYRSGKSYFMSRLLGSLGAFQLGHSMRACTRGIWMATTILECEEFATIFLATTILECEEFATIFLDTEGIDAVGASETMAMSLLTLTTLLSSYLIYNSKKVLLHFTNKLVREYEREMEESLKGILPLKEKNLMRIHEQKLKRKKHKLQQEVCRINPLNSTKEDVDPLVSELEQEIIKWSKPDDGAKREVVGGVLFQFTTQNYSKSKQHCEELFGKLVEHFKLKDKVAEAVQSSKTLEIKKEIQAITHHYNMVAVGPASSEVREKGLMELNQLGKTLKMIPGCPQDVKLIGRGPDRNKLSWEPPAHNPEAAEVYVVSIRVEGGAWEEVKRTKHTKALVTGLKSKKKYEFKVMAANKTLISLANEKKSETEWSKAFCAAVGFATGVVCAPFATIGMLTCLVVEEIKNGSETTRTNSVEEIEAKVVEGIKCGSGTTTTTSVEEIEEIKDFKLSTRTIVGRF